MSDEKKTTAIIAIQQQFQAPAVIESLKAATPNTLANYLTPERVTRMVMSSVSRNQTLLKCSPISIAKAAADAVRLGLEPGSALGHAYLVPFKNSNAQTWDAQFIPGYRGYIALARRSGVIKSVAANVVYEFDRFILDLASGERPSHKPYLGKDGRGKPIAVYAIADFVDGGHHLDMMTIAEIMEVRDKSPAAKSGPWVTHFTEMARKTVIRRAAKYWPLSTEMADALEHERKIDIGDFRDVINGSLSPDPEDDKPSKTQDVLKEITSEQEEIAFAEAQKQAWVDEKRSRTLTT
jgi:recombination protein RecT